MATSNKDAGEGLVEGDELTHHPAKLAIARG